MLSISVVVLAIVFTITGSPDKTILNNIQVQNIGQCRVLMSEELRMIANMVGMDMVDGIWRQYPAKWTLVAQTANSMYIKSGRHNLKISCLEVFE